MYDVSFVIEIRIPFQYLPYTNPTSNIQHLLYFCADYDEANVLQLTADSFIISHPLNSRLDGNIIYLYIYYI